MYRIQMQNEDTCEILLYSLIERGWTTNSVIEQLESKPNVKNIDIRINSDGGEVFEALTLYNYLKSRNANITVYIDGIAASAASVIACVGRVVMPPTAMLMIHNPYGFVQGDGDELREFASVLDKIRDSVIEVYQAKTGKDKDTIAGLIQDETWLTAEEALKLGFCDEILTERLPEAEPDPGEVANAIRKERKRLQELDALMTPERRSIIMKAKYETLQSAKDIAIELLQMQARAEDNNELRGINADYRPDVSGVNDMAEFINRKRGYNDGRR